MEKGLRGFLWGRGGIWNGHHEVGCDVPRLAAPFAQFPGDMAFIAAAAAACKTVVAAADSSVNATPIGGLRRRAFRHTFYPDHIIYHYADHPAPHGVVPGNSV